MCPVIVALPGHNQLCHNHRFKITKIIRIYHECEGEIEKSIPRTTDWIQVASACQVMTNGDREGMIVSSHILFLLTAKYDLV